MIIHLRLEALTDLCLNSGNHTLGQAETHDHIPGRTLWGALAGIAYRRGMADDLAFRLFHQGALRVADGVPLWAGQRTYPVPSSWHHPKENPDADAENFAVKSQEGETQYKGHKSGWITPGLERATIERNFTLRTAVDGSGKARQGLLYGIPVLKAGTQFTSRIEGSEADLKDIRRLVDGQELRLGRSRNSELGLVKVTVLERAPHELTHGNGQSSQVSFLCVSRCVFRDPATGAPTLTPGATALGLEGDWTFEPSRSFLRTARIVHFNSKRSRPENERFAVERGSVLTFNSKKTIAVADVVKRVKDGVGEFRGQGYGEVLVNPEWLTKETFSLKEANSAGPAREVAPPTDELFQWAQKQANQRRKALGLYAAASQAAREYHKYKVPPSQWGALRAMVREARFTSSDVLFEQIFGKDGKSGFLNDGKRRLSKSWERARGPLQSLCEKRKPDLPVFLELLAAACMRPGHESKNGGKA